MVLAAPLACVAAEAQQQSQQPPQEKVLRYAMRVAETGFDPVQVTDKYSRDMLGNIFDVGSPGTELEFAL